MSDMFVGNFLSTGEDSDVDAGRFFEGVGFGEVTCEVSNTGFAALIRPASLNGTPTSLPIDTGLGTAYVLAYGPPSNIQSVTQRAEVSAASTEGSIFVTNLTTTGGSYDVYVLTPGQDINTATKVNTMTMDGTARTFARAGQGGGSDKVVADVDHPSNIYTVHLTTAGTRTIVASSGSINLTGGELKIVVFSEDPTSPTTTIGTIVQQQACYAGPTTLAAFGNAATDAGPLEFKVGDERLTRLGGSAPPAPPTIAWGNGLQADGQQIQTPLASQVVPVELKNQSGVTNTFNFTIEANKNYRFFAIGRLTDGTLAVAARVLPNGYVPPAGHGHITFINGRNAGPVDVYLLDPGVVPGPTNLLATLTFSQQVSPPEQAAGQLRWFVTEAGNIGNVITDTGFFTHNAGSTTTWILNRIGISDTKMFLFGP